MSRRPVVEHRSAIAALLRPIAAVDQIDVGDAYGLVTARTATATTALPVFDNSQMDGFAVRAADVAEGVALPVVQRVFAGSAADPLPRGTASAIMTGAPVPQGADAVIPVEESHEVAAGEGSTVTFDARPSVGAFVRRAGSDIAAGEVIVESGTTLAPRHLGALAAAGVAAVSVWRRPDVAIIVTGSELAPPSASLRPGQIYESNSVALAALAASHGAKVVSVAVVGDGPGEFRERLDEATRSADVVLTSGGVSAGEREPVRDLLADSSAGATESWFGALAMQPGGPQGLSRWQGVPVISLPGNPVSVLVSFEVLVRDALRAVAGLPAVAGERCRVVSPTTSPPGKTQFLRGRRAGGDGVPRVEIVGGPGSHLIATAARADVLVEVDAAVTELTPDMEVPLWPLTP
ncbi:molybdopterin biosynthesis protein MoeA [Gordonia araii NBRC 100433]|uniref:Molybdopterin molybdenumtransferase n=1 Tax=Gordonia araii NBRC 100433 TaxID=1073574 RepID=G7H111_9ACTN|nr:gephyrin-like molybdotransferase Glp [Gordonia araii]NNG96740.1 molybdopterin molybdotransferase MoeA [Gordonia araii NBRC 100433]GAB09572.1 molybdopterin biosynthesis protein MoeA [Gordonia araii NBRC 100433]